MDARTNIETRLPGRHLTAGPGRESHRHPSNIVTGHSLENAAAVMGKSGGSNAAPHLPTARFDLFDAAEIFKKTPYAAGLKPGCRYVAKDIFDVGGIRSIAEIDTDAGTLNVKLTAAVLADRKTKWTARKTNHRSGVLCKFAQQIGPAGDGAVTYPGVAHEKQCHAGI